jgi:hypothetical protein
MTAEIVFYAILVYLVYKLVFNFIMPVSQVSRQMKEQFRNVRETVQEHANHANQAGQQEAPDPVKRPDTTRRKADDYIDFEEIK